MDDTMETNDIHQLKHIITTQQHKIKQLSQDYETLVSNIVANLPIHVYWKDSSGKYLGCNALMAQKGGYQNWQDVIGKTDHDMSWKQNAKQLREHDLYVMTTGDTVTEEEPGYTAKGEKRTFLSKKTPLRDPSGTTIGVVGMSIDITEKKIAEELTLKQSIAQEIIHKLKIIAGSLSHEIRTPFAGIRLGLGNVKKFIVDLNTNNLLKEELSTQVQESLIDKMIEKIDMSTALINLQLKNMTTEKVDSKLFCFTSITKVIKDAMDHFPFENKETANKIYLHLGSEFDFWGEPLLAKHIIWNLLNNALRYIKELDRGHITITTDITEKYYLLKFRDTARGMSTEEVNNLFKPFYTTSEKGNGLGLNFCRLVMESFKGEIYCHSELGEFTEFILKFPKLTV